MIFKRFNPSRLVARGFLQAAALIAMFCSMVIVSSLAGAAGAGSEPPPLDFIPSEWREVSIVWKGSWDETLRENIQAISTNTLAKNPNFKHAVGTIACLREIELYKALIERFPDQRGKRGEAYLAIAAIYDKIGMPAASAFYALKTTREFTGDAKLVPEAYRILATLPVDGTAAHESGWMLALYDALDRAEKGAIPAGHDSVFLACEGIRRRICSEMRYDDIPSILARFKKLAAGDPRINQTIVELMLYYGDAERALAFTPRKQEGEWWQGNDSVRPPAGHLPDLPGKFELETRLEAFVQGAQNSSESRPVDPAQVQKLLDLAVGSNAYLKKGDSHYVSYRDVIQHALDSLPEVRIESLRAEQEKIAGRLVRSIRGGDDVDELARLSRRYPYAASVHGALVESGEHALRDGGYGAAAQAFREVIRHSNDVKLCAEARIGLCLALAASPSDSLEMESVLGRIPDGVEVDWQGALVPAGRVKAEFLPHPVGIAGREWRTLSAMPRLSFALPADWPLTEWHTEGPLGDYGLHAPWPVTRIEKRGQSCLVSGPRRIACFRAGTPKHVWDAVLPESGEGPGPFKQARAPTEYMPQAWRDLNRRPVEIQGGWSQAAAEVEPVTYLLSGGGMSVDALDTRTGKVRWSTAGRNEWQGLVPMNQPAASHGRVYVLAVPIESGAQRTGAAVKSRGPWTLVCLDGRHGSVLWKVPVSWQKDGVLDLARYGTPVTIHEGAVYCCPGMGILARCDARDGRLDWVRGYAGTVRNVASPDALVYSREGTSPVVVGNRLFAAPRDSSGVMAVNADTGDLLWDTAMVPSDRMLGVVGKALVIMNEEWLAALDVASGKQIWLRRFPEGTGARGAVVGQNVVTMSGRRLYLISAETGKTVEEGDFDGDANADYAYLADGTLVGSMPPRLSGGQRLAAPMGAPLAPPLVQSAHIPCESPGLVAPGMDAGNGGVFSILSGRRIMHVVTEPELKVVWDRVLPVRSLAAHIVGSLLMLSTDQRLTAVDLADGVQRWTLTVPFLPHEVGGDNRLMLALPGSHGEGQIAAIDPAAGKLLWTRSLVERARFRGGINRVELVHGGSGPGTMKVGLRTLFADTGWQSGEVEMETNTGRITAVRPFAAQQEDSLWFCCDGLVYAGADPGARIAPGGAVVAGRKYELPKADCPGVYEVFAHKTVGNRFVVISGATGRSRGAYKPEQSRVYVDFFERDTGQHVTRQTLDGVTYCTGGLTGYDTQAMIFDRGIVVTDTGGVHVFVTR